MVRIVKVPADVRRHCSANELSGWMDGVQYTPLSRRRKKKRRRIEPEAIPYRVPPPKPFAGGKEL